MNRIAAPWYPALLCALLLVVPGSAGADLWDGPDVYYYGDQPVFSLANAGDLDGDGYQDLAFTGTDRVNVCYGPISSGGSLASPDVVLPVSVNGWPGPVASTAGDVNGDGYGDLVVGARTHDEPYQSDNGWFAVYLGTSDGLATSPDFARAGATGDELGAGVGYAGDVNGDGYDDVYVVQVGNTPTVFVYLGGPGGLQSSPAWSHTFSSTLVTAAPAGDVDGDGRDDLVVGDAAAGPDGYVYLFLGTTTGLRSTASATLYGNGTASSFGYRLFTAGDVNGDGYADIAVADPFADNGISNQGCVYVFLGGTDLPGPAADWTVYGPAENHQLGLGLATAGDVNGDGYADLLVGSDQVVSGETRLYLGSADGLATTPSDVLPAAERLCGVDVDGDGFNDVFLGSGSLADDLYGYFGHAADPATLANWQLVGTAESEAGRSLALGDLNGDGYTDLAVGLPGYDADRGRVQIYYGSRYGLNDPFPDRTLTGANEGDGFGYALSAAGDLNGDGYADLAVGIPFYDGAAGNSGRVQVFFGSATGIGYVADVTIDGSSGEFGLSLSTAGDANGDGYADLLVGAPFVTIYSGGTFHPGAGRVRLFPGGSGGPSTTAAWSYTTGVTNAKVGSSVALVGDTNRDGYADLLVGAPGENGGNGRAFCFLGGESGPASTPVWTRDGVVGSYEYLGNMVTGAGDVNGDGYADLALGIRYADDSRGRVEVFLGSGSGPQAGPTAAFGSTDSGDYMGWAVAAAGDVDGDGYGDLAVGVPGRDRVDVIHGCATGLETARTWQVARSAGSSFGVALAGLGDTDGDGFPDLLVGAAGADVGGTDTGEVFCFPGNGRVPVTASPALPRQLRTSSDTPIAAGGASDSPGSFRIRLRGRSAAGRQTVRVQYRRAPWGGGWSWSAIATGLPYDTGDPGSGGSAVEITETVGGLAEDTPYQWQARIVGRSPYFHATPWYTAAGVPQSLTALRTEGAPSLPNLVVTGIVPTSTNDGAPLTVDITVANTGTVAADASVTSFSLDGSAVCADIATPAIPAGGSTVVTCEAGWVSAGSHVMSACADAADAVTESDEGDNCRTVSLAVTAHPLLTVAPDGSGDVPTIADALALVSPGGTVELLDGTFTGEGNRDLRLSGKTVTMRSASGDSSTCVIDAQGTASENHRGILVTSGAELHLEYLTIRGGWIANGALVSVNAAALYAVGCVFADGDASNAGGASNFWNSGGRFDHCRFEGNHAVWGGGALYLYESAPVISMCLFVDNTCDHWGGAVHGQYTASDFELASCTFAGNGADEGSCVYVRNGSRVTIGNSILAFGTGGQPVWDNGGEVAQVTCCDVFGNADGDFVGALAAWSASEHENFSADPLFCDRVGGDYRLSSASPCSEEQNPGCGSVGACPVGCTATGVGDPPAADLPRTVVLGLPAPNPFNPSTEVAFGLPSAGPATVAVYDLAGRRVRTLLDEPSLAAGYHALRWNGRDDAGRAVAAGVYLVRLRAGDVQRLRKVVLVQ